MATVKIAEYLDKDAGEVLLEITSGVVTVHAYCDSIRGIREQKTIKLYGFQTWNVGPCTGWYKPRRDPAPGFGYHICAEVVNIRARLVRLGDIEITLDTPLDSEWPVGSLICFDVARLDY